MSIRRGVVEAETFSAKKATRGEIGEPFDMHAIAAVEAPLRIMRQNKLLGRFDDATRKGKPVKARHHKPAERFERAPRLCRSVRGVEPVPALSRDHGVKGTVGLAGFFRATEGIIDAGAFGRAEAACFIQQIRRRIEADDGATASRESARDGSCSGAKIEDTIACCHNAKTEKALEKLPRKTGAVAPIIGSGLTKIDDHIIHSFENRLKFMTILWQRQRAAVVCVAGVALA